MKVSSMCINLRTRTWLMPRRRRSLSLRSGERRSRSAAATGAAAHHRLSAGAGRIQPCLWTACQSRPNLAVRLLVTGHRGHRRPRHAAPGAPDGGRWPKPSAERVHSIFSEHEPDVCVAEVRAIARDREAYNIHCLERWLPQPDRCADDLRKMNDRHRIPMDGFRQPPSGIHRNETESFVPRERQVGVNRRVQRRHDQEFHFTGTLRERERADKHSGKQLRI